MKKSLVPPEIVVLNPVGIVCFYYLIEDYIVAKRRNLKKEKAERNQAYARQFRQKTSRSFSRGRSYSNNSNNQDDKNEDDNDNN